MKLYREFPCPDCKGNPEKICPTCQNKRTILEPLDPADLELGYAKAWEKLKKRIAKDKAEVERVGIHPSVAAYLCVETMIADLESGLDLGEMRKLREKARAWKIAEKWMTRGRVDALLAQAQAELEKEEKK